MKKQNKALECLENMFYQMKPKYRYTSENHVEEYTESIYKEIINGDVEVSKHRLQVNYHLMQIDSSPHKKEIEQLLRRKFLDQAEK